MTPVVRLLFAQAWASLKTPREVARWVMSFDLPRVMRWEVLLLVVILSTMLAQFTVTFVASEQAMLMGQILANPWTTSIIQMSVLVIAVFSVYWIGRAMGGTGGFGDAILLVAWLQFCMFCLQLVQTAAMLVMPPVAGLLGLAGFAVFFWLLTNFVAELHGFRSLPQVFLMILVSILALVFGVSLILAVIGISVPGAGA